MTDLLSRAHVFERGDRLYITTPITLLTPSAQQVEEFAFASTVKSMAPNEHIGWLQGRYVESGKANLNGHMWLSEEIALKALTPMLMPVTVMHDPRTAVGTIADCKLIEADRSRLETILAIWRHRFGPVWEEAEANIKAGTMMQSMECKAPWYSCSECGQSYVKLSEGREQANWCEHLRDRHVARILGDVCFTGTGLIFGSRGGRGAYTEAHLDHFQDEIAEFHERAHIDGNYKPREEPPKMGLVQIEESELATLRQERNDARKDADEKASEVRDLTAKVEKAEGEAAAEKTAREAAEKERDELKSSAQTTALRDKRFSALGAGFVAKLGEVTKANLQEQAGTLSDEDWNSRLAEVEELTKTKRDEAAGAASGNENGGGGEGSETASSFGESFTPEELASFNQRGVTAPATANGNGSNAARSLARALKPQRPKAEATK